MHTLPSMRKGRYTFGSFNRLSTLMVRNTHIVCTLLLKLNSVSLMLFQLSSYTKISFDFEFIGLKLVWTS